MNYEQLESRIEELFNDGDLGDHIDVSCSIDLEEGFESFRDEVQTLIDQTNITYYATAMEYLKEHDTSLIKSLGLAGELGYSLGDSNLNSELLATLLLQQDLREEFSEIEDDIEELFEEFEEEEEEEEESLTPYPDDIVISSNGFKYSVGSEDYGHIGDYEEMEEALESVKNWKKENNYFPTVWFSSDHGNMHPIDEEGNEI